MRGVLMSSIDRDRYQQQGYLILPGLFTAAEAAHWQAECDRLLTSPVISRDNARTPFRFGATTAPERIDPVIDISPGFAALVADDRITDAVSVLLGERPLLFKDKLLFKAPGVDGYQMHQDWAWGWQDLCPADQILSVSIQIDGADPANGSIELYEGYHDRLLTPPGEATNFREAERALIDPDRGRAVQTNPGDVLIFHALTPHRSGRNTSTRSRRSLYLTMNAASVGDLRTRYYAGYRADPSLHGGTHFR